MIRNYIKTAFRNLIRHKMYSLLNVAGLAIGVACCIFILLYVQDELSYDRFNEKSDRIYRLIASINLSGKPFEAAMTTHAMGPIFSNECPEIEMFTRLSTYGDRRVVQYEDKSFNEERFLWADSTLFTMFSFELIKGNPKTVLVNPNSVVITEDIANKYFGVEEPIGKNLIVHNETEYTVTGVVKNIPHNSHFRPDFIASFSTLSLQREATILEDMLGNFNYYGFFLLREGADKIETERKFAGFVEENLGAFLKTTGVTLELLLQPLTEIHLHSDLEGEIENNSDITYVYLFSGIGLFILLIACLNFMNLATARSANRAKEVGMRKVVGAYRIQLIIQFISESMIMGFIAVVIAVFIVFLAMSFFSNISGKEFTNSSLANPVLYAGLAALFLVVGIIGGSYPAFFLSAFRPVDVLSGALKRGAKSSILRIVLVSLQFTVTIILIIGTLTINNQINFMVNRDLGYNKEQVLAFTLRNAETREKIDVIKSELIQHPGIIAVSASRGLPNNPTSSSLHHPAGRPDEENLLMSMLFTDDEFIDLYEIEVLEGRKFSKEYSTDFTEAILINESAVKALGWQDDPLGKEIEYFTGVNERGKRTVIGVVKDFHFESLHNEIRPLAIYNSLMWNTDNPDDFNVISVRTKTDNVQETVGFLKSKWKEFDSRYPFEYFFVDEQYDAFYRAEEHMGQLFEYFTVLAIIIGCLGLFGLASYTAEQRTKEIGIRKVLGATAPNIILLLVREFTKWIVIAVVVAWPAGYFLMNSWLQNFAYRIDLGAVTFITAAGIALLIAVFTVGYQAVKAALSSPVNALKYE